MKLKLPSDFSSALFKVSFAGMLFLGVCQEQAMAGTNGYDYRTKANGAWNSAGTWERNNAGNWEDIVAADVPDATAGTITIQNSHTVTLTSSTNADQLTVATSGMLILSNANLAVNDGAGADITVNGTLVTNTSLLTGSGDFTLAPGGNLEIGSAVGITNAGSAGNIQVNGSRNYSSAANYMYNGGAAQVTGNGLPGNTNILRINNLAGVTLSQATVVNNLVLRSGKLKTGTSNSLVMAANGVISEASAVSYVEGPLSATLNVMEGDMVFPVGKNGNFRTISLTIGQSSTTPTIYTVEQLEGDYPTALNLGATLEKVSGSRFYNLASDGATTMQEGFITMTYGNNDYVTDKAFLTIAKSEGSDWVDLKGFNGTTDGGTANGAGSIYSTANFNTLGTFILANKIGGTNPLPVELVKFSAAAKASNVVLDWTTASEKNNDYFLVERSRNGKTFEAVGKVAGNGTSSAAKAYSLTDKNLPAGLHYYRLKQVDLNGAYEYSQVIKVNVGEKTNTISVYPNPTNSILNVNTVEALTQVCILNVLGQEVYRKTVNISQSAGLDVSFLTAGTYQLLLDGNQKTSVTSFIKTDR